MISYLVLYDNPLDFPGFWIVREQRIVDGAILRAPIAFIFQTKQEVLQWLEPTIWTPMALHPDDDPVIAATWIL